MVERAFNIYQTPETFPGRTDKLPRIGSYFLPPIQELYLSEADIDAQTRRTQRLLGTLWSVGVMFFGEEETSSLTASLEIPSRRLIELGLVHEGAIQRMMNRMTHLKDNDKSQIILQKTGGSLLITKTHVTRDNLFTASGSTGGADLVVYERFTINKNPGRKFLVNIEEAYGPAHVHLAERRFENTELKRDGSTGRIIEEPSYSPPIKPSPRALNRLFGMLMDKLTTGYVTALRTGG